MSTPPHGVTKRVHILTVILNAWVNPNSRLDIKPKYQQCLGFH